MKKIFTTFLVVAVVNVYSQTSKDTAQFFIGDFVERSYLSMDTENHIRIFGDTMQAIKHLLSEVDQVTKKLDAAKAILDCVTVYGFVFNSNRIRFNNAVKQWLLLNHDKRKVDKMQKLHILTYRQIIKDYKYELKK